MRTMIQVLDRARTVQKVQSDYKLALCLGIGANSVSNYRTGRSLPDEKAAAKLADAMGEKPDLLLVEIQAQRVKDPEARQLWESLAKRLQSGFANVRMLAVLAIVSVAAAALPAWATIYLAANAAVQSVYYVNRLMKAALIRALKNVKFCKDGRHVPRHPHPTARSAAR